MKKYGKFTRMISVVLVVSLLLPILTSCDFNSPSADQGFDVQKSISPYFSEIISPRNVQTVINDPELEDTEITLSMNDGSLTSYVFTEPVKFIDDQGNVQYKDTSIVEQTDESLLKKGYDYTNGSNDYRIHFSTNSRTGIYAGKAGAYFSSIPQNAKQVQGNPVMSERCGEKVPAFLYEGIYGEGTSLYWFPELNGIKEEIVLSSYTGTNRFSFLLSTYGCTAEIAADGRVQLKNDDEIIQEFKPAFAYDSEGGEYSQDEHYVDGKYYLEELDEQKYILTIEIPKEFLESSGTKYPVTIDPVTSNLTNSQDTPIHSKFASQSFYKDSNGVGCSSSMGSTRSLMKFNLPTDIKKGATINSAYYWMRELTGRTGTCYIGIHQVTSAWNNSTTWKTQPSFSSTQLQRRNINSTSKDSSLSPYWYKFNIKNAVHAWTHGSTNYGLILKSETETDMNQALFRLFGNLEYSSSNFRPYAVINYTNDTAAPTISSVSGNPTSWTKNDVVLTVNGANDNGGAGLHAQPYSFSTTKGTYSWQSSNKSSAINANKTIYVYVRDAIGNIALRSTVTINKIDKSVPTVTGAVFNPSGWNNSQVTMTIEAKDTGGSGISSYSFDNGVTWQNENSKIYTSNASVTVKVKDAAGNISASKAFSITNIDKGVPTILRVDGNPSEWTNQDVTLKVIAEDNQSGISEYSFDNGITWQTSNQKTYQQNTNNIIIKVKDMTGNISTFQPISITKIDKTAPIEPILSEEYGGPSIELPAMSESEKALYHCEYKIDDGEWKDAEVGSLLEVPSLSDYTLTIRAYDTAGNYSQAIRKQMSVPNIHYIESTSDVSISCGAATFDFGRQYSSETNQWFYSVNSCVADYTYEQETSANTWDSKISDEIKVVLMPDGSKLYLKKSSENEYHNRLTNAKLIPQDDGWKLDFYADNMEYLFNNNGQLSAIQDSNGNSIAITREDDQITVKDSYDRVYKATLQDGKIICIEDAAGNQYQYAYTADGQLQSVTDPTGVLIGIYTYSDGKLTRSGNRAIIYENGKLKKETMDNGSSVTYTYQIADNKIQQVDTSENKTEITFNKYGLPSRTQENSDIVFYTYDAVGRVLSKTVDTQETFYEYDDAGNLLSETTEDIEVRSYLYDSENRLIREKNEDDQYTYYLYDDKGNILTTAVLKDLAEGEDPPLSYTPSSDQSRFDTVTYTYNADGTIHTTEDSVEGQQFAYTYDTWGNQIKSVKTTDYARGTSITLSTYDILGNLLSSTDEEGRKTTSVYDAAGRLLRQDADGQVTRNLYDGKGRLVQQIDPDHYNADKDGLNQKPPVNTYADPDIGQRYVYAENGNLTYEINPDGKITGYTYDAYGNRSSQQFDMYTFTYTPKGNISTAKIGKQIIANYVYDDEGNLTEVDYANGQKIRSNYSDNHKLLQVTYDDEESPRFTYTYDELGELESKTDLVNHQKTVYNEDVINIYNIAQDGTETLVHSYESTDELFKEMAVGNTWMVNLLEHRDQFVLSENKSLNKSYTYDVDDKLTASRVYLQENTNEQTLFSTDYTYDEDRVTALEHTIGTTRDKYEYSYNEKHNISSVSHNGKAVRYTYDDDGQLVRADDQELGKSFVYQYDDRGNLTGSSEYAYSTGELGAAVTNDTYTYGKWLDRLTAFNGKPIGYDAAGNRTGYDGWTYVWEAGRQLKRMTKNGSTIDYKYDDNGIRTEKTVNGVTTKYTTIDGRITSQTDGTNTLYFRYDSKNELFGVNVNGTEYVYVKNLQGDVTGIADMSGNVVVQYRYDPWGQVESVSGSLADTLGQLNPMRYRGYYLDSETGYYYLQSRYYEPEMRRFINADDILLAKLTNNNLFSYCKNNPIALFDPNGDLAIAISVVSFFTALAFGTALIISAYAILSDSNVQKALTQLIQTTGNGIKTLCREIVSSINVAREKAAKKPRRNKYEKHHIVAKKAVSAKPARDVLSRVGIKVNDPINLVSLRYNLHRHLHTKRYYYSVNSLLTSAVRKSANRYLAVKRSLNYIRLALLAASRSVP